MLPSDEMRNRFKVAYANCNKVDWDDTVEECLAAALAPYEAPPFVLSDDEAHCLDIASRGVSDAGVVRALVRALDRARKTLGVAHAAPVGDLLTPSQRTFVESHRPLLKPGMPTCNAWLDIIDHLAPKPAPAVKTPGQVLCEQLKGTWEHGDQGEYERIAAAVLAAHGAK